VLPQRDEVAAEHDHLGIHLGAIRVKYET